MKKRELRLPETRLEVMLEASTLDLDARTVEVRWYSGAKVQQFSWDIGPHLLSLSMDPKHVRLGQMKGAPLKSGHRGNNDLGSVLGVIDKAWIENGEGHAVARFSSRKDVQPIMQDVRDGILTHVSMEAAIYELEDVTKKGDAQKHFHAIDWEPHAVALVALGADPDARTLSSGETFPCTITTRAGSALKETKMSDELDTDTVGDAKPDAPVTKTNDKTNLSGDDWSEDRELKDTIEADTRRSARIRELQAHFGLDDLWAQRHIRLGSTVKAASAEAKKKIAETAHDIDGRIKFGEDYESLGWKIERMSEALASRALAKECPEPARAFARATLADCGYNVLHQLGMTRGRALDPIRQPYEVIKLAMGTTDFPGILANVLNKTLLPVYQAAAPSFRTFAARRDFRDYRPHKFIRAGDFPLPLQVGEGGEITQGSMGEGSETVTALKYGRILAILYEVLVNDDLGAFVDFGGMVARRITDFENATFYTRCIAAGSGLGPNMADGVAVYNAAHGSNVNTGGVLDNTRLGEAFGKMAAQTSIDGLKLNVPPKYVLTSTTSHITARTLLAAIYPAQASAVNPFAGIMEPIYDANLSSVRYYVLADPAIGSNYIYGTIGGAGPRFEVRPGFEVEGVQVKVVHDFGCGAIDYRYGITGAGV